MSRQIALGNIKVRSLSCFEIAFEKYQKELEEKGVTPLPTFKRVKKPTVVLGTIHRNNRILGNLLFQGDKGETKPKIEKNGEITNGFAILKGDEDYLKGKALEGTNPIEHNRLDAYYTGEATTKILQDLGFNCEDYTVDQDCSLEFEGTREVEENLVGSF